MAFSVAAVTWVTACGSTATNAADDASRADADADAVAEAAGPDSGGADASIPGVPDAPVAPGGKIKGTVGKWVWNDIEGTQCANGTPTGVGVNLGTGPHVVIYMSGGSACLDEECKIGTPSMRKDGGFGAPQMAACADGKDCDGAVTFPAKSIFDRSSAVNPFANATYVFISNCAGDYYVGDADHVFPSWTAHFHGSRNQRLISAEVAASFPTASRVIVAGGSAGSVGAMLNYWQWVKAFPSKRVDLISDSFALVFADRPQWRYDLHNPQLPPGCATCGTDYRTVYDHNVSLAPGSRLAVLDSENNWTLDLTSGYKYTEGLRALQPNLDRLPNVRYYIANGNVHILMQHPLDNAAIDVTRVGEPTRYLNEFLSAMQSDSATWTSATCLR